MLRSADQLISVPDPAWPIVLNWLATAGSHAHALDVSDDRGCREIVRLQVTARSTLGAIALNTGGVLVQNGWLRILGCGHSRCNMSISDATQKLGWCREGEPPGAVAVGIDVVGGLFAINGGAISAQGAGEVFYFAPDSLRWESLNCGHTDWVRSMLEPARVNGFYEDLRWTGWEAECAALPANSGFSFYLLLCTRESRPIERTNRRPIPLTELLTFGIDIAAQLDNRQHH